MMPSKVAPLALGLVVVALVLAAWWSFRPAPPTPALKELPRATGALVQRAAEQRVVRARADTVTQQAADTVTVAVARVQATRATRPLDLSAALVAAAHIHYVGQLELDADALAAASAVLVAQDSAFRALARAQADSMLAHAVRIDTLARAAVTEAAAQHGRGLRRGLAIGALLGAALTLGLAIFTP